MRLDERQNKFIGYLLNLAKEGQEDRGALADLRSGLGKQPGEMARVHKHVVQFLPEKDHNDRWYYWVATLFGAFPRHREGSKWGAPSLGEAFAPLRKKSDSMEKRFVALLNAHPDDLYDHLRHAVSLLESHKPPLPLNWFGLFDDLLQWDRPDGRVQLDWARDFYKAGSSISANQADLDSTAKEEDPDHERFRG
jgi:CRISPR system Cascade subunit CasB